MIRGRVFMDLNRNGYADPGEPGIPDQVIDDLIARGHRAQRGGVGFGGYQAVMVDGEHNTLQGGSDPRKDGCAMGY